MPSRGDERRLATVLFIDIVGSTSVASDLGDARWRGLLSRFRGIVRDQLKREGGREQNFTGDGFLATFAEPARAVRAAEGIAQGVRELGIEVRSGVHTGEIETIEGHVGGLGVHVGARVMSVAGPGEVLVTSTVKDLVVGSPFAFEPFAVHELKGVPGTWQLYALAEVGGEPVPRPMNAADAVARLTAIGPDREGRRRGRWMVAAAVVAAVAVVVVAIVITAGGSNPITMVKIDPKTGTISKTLDDRYYSLHTQNSLWTQNGTIWQGTPTEVVGRDPVTGAVRTTLPLGGGIENGTFALGFGWAATPKSVGVSRVEEVDLVSGKVVATVDVPGPIVSMAGGDGAVWTVTRGGSLARIDPLHVKNVKVWNTSATAAGVLVPEAGYVWICDCDHGRIVQFDPNAGRERRVLTLPEHGYIVGVASPKTDEVWVLDPSGSTLTPLDPTTGKPGQPLGLGGNPVEASIAFGAIWVAAGANVYEIDLKTLHQRVIGMPDPVFAGSITADESSGVIWVANCGCPRS
jgi:class 3 adenylate cyclase/streptogramin lyase